MLCIARLNSQAQCLEGHGAIHGPRVKVQDGKPLCNMFCNCAFSRSGWTVNRNMNPLLPFHLQFTDLPANTPVEHAICKL